MFLQQQLNQWTAFSSRLDDYIQSVHELADDMALSGKFLNHFFCFQRLCNIQEAQHYVNHFTPKPRPGLLDRVNLVKLVQRREALGDWKVLGRHSITLTNSDILPTTVATTRQPAGRSATLPIVSRQAKTRDEDPWTH